MSLALVVIR